MRSSLIRNPWINPTKTPNPSVAAIAMNTLLFSPFITIADTRMDTLTSEPTDRSMPAVKMTSICPKATIPRKADCRATFVRLRSLKKRSDCVVPMMNKTIIKTKTAKTGPLRRKKTARDLLISPNNEDDNFMSADPRLDRWSPVQ